MIQFSAQNSDGTDIIGIGLTEDVIRHMIFTGGMMLPLDDIGKADTKLMLVVAKTHEDLHMMIEDGFIGRSADGENLFHFHGVGEHDHDTEA